MRSLRKQILKIEEFILSSSIIIMAIILIGNVISRSIFNKSWSFAEEIGQLLVISTTFIGVSYCAKKGKHISMSALFDLCNIKTKKIMMFVITLLTSLILFYLAYVTLIYTIKINELGRVTPALRIPFSYFSIFMPIGFFLGGIEYFQTFILNIQKKEIYLSADKYIEIKETEEVYQEEKLEVEKG